uniref:Uncharacterized protein n=1 Tax=Arundo donax TaxID=35708 RepID=A0A0A8Y2E7_ARUDO
MQATAAGRQ